MDNFELVAAELTKAVINNKGEIHKKGTLNTDEVLKVYYEILEKLKNKDSKAV